jgi:hypothetical protein
MRVRPDVVTKPIDTPISVNAANTSGTGQRERHATPANAVEGSSRIEPVRIVSDSWSRSRGG